MNNGALFLEEFAPQIFLPILQPLQLIRKHLGTDDFSFRLYFFDLFLQHLVNIFPGRFADDEIQIGQHFGEDKESVAHVVGKFSIDHIHSQLHSLYNYSVVLA